MPEAERPLIGMPARLDPGTEQEYLSRHYGESIAAAGGVPAIIPLLESPGVLGGLAERLDGIVLTGSKSDVDPTRYGAAVLPACGPIQVLRDRTDFELLEVAVARRIPVLGICYGMQSLNVHFGGSLIQDIPSARATSIRHSNPAANSGFAHKVALEEASLLGRLAGELEPRVNSTHHQAVDRPADGFTVTARAEDGIIEGLEWTADDHWIVGVQWHPERSYPFDPFSRRIFRDFIAQCRARREEL